VSRINQWLMELPVGTVLELVPAAAFTLIPLPELIESGSLR
jgi:hypothetical protein